MKKYLFLVAAVSFLFVSCTQYQKIIKSTDNELKYDKAVEYFHAKKYAKAIGLFDDITPAFRGTDRSELILNYLGQSYLGQKDYFSASEYYKTYIKSYPRGRFIQEAKYMVGYCYYKDSPDSRLDQEATYKAIDAFQNYLDEFPDSERAKDAVKLLDELNNKLAKKYYQNAKLYYNLGTYLGNNYSSAVITAENGLKKYPSNIYREDFLILILQSKYQEALLSLDERKEERYQAVIDEYYNYYNEFPQGKFIKDANKILQEAKKAVKE
ncbi:Outer membrane assembly lipoprotein YfiO [uncultured Paludibacter sp.]|nr:Outer membrane assembly lipoprotein YfiO [uncultured Paludibacter sp.]